MGQVSENTTRERILDVAERLFAERGFDATSLRNITTDAAVNLAAVNYHFGSKDELILAALKRRDARWREWFGHALARRAESPRGRLLAVFDALEEWFAQADFQGCMFMRAASEFCACDDPIHAASAEHQRLFLAELRDLAAAAGAQRPAKLAREILLLVMGAIVATQVSGPVDAGQAAKKAAAVLLDAALEPDGGA